MTKNEALKLALEALETCNWVDDGGYGHAEYDHVSTNQAITAIKEALAQRTWVGLTDEEITTLDMETSGTTHDFVDAIEAALRSKNT